MIFQLLSQKTVFFPFKIFFHILKILYAQTQVLICQVTNSICLEAVGYSPEPPAHGSRARAALCRVLLLLIKNCVKAQQ